MASLPGLSGTMSLSPSATLPTAVERRRPPRHGCPALLHWRSTSVYRDLLNLVTKQNRACLSGSPDAEEAGNVGELSASLHDYYIDSIHGDQDDGLPPETHRINVSRHTYKGIKQHDYGGGAHHMTFSS